jgi:hypothetical protein
MRDTTDEAERVRMAAVRRMSGAERLRQALDVSEVARLLAFAGLRMRYPGRSDRELAELYLGRSMPGGNDRSGR